MNQPVREGGCSCGRIRFQAAGEPRFVANCHCTDCRRATSAAFSTWAGFSDDQLTWHGERREYASSPGVKRGFCGICGTPLSYQGSKWPGETHILVGTFDKPDAFTPSCDVFVDDALSWARPAARD